MTATEDDSDVFSDRPEEPDGYSGSFNPFSDINRVLGVLGDKPVEWTPDAVFRGSMDIEVGDEVGSVGGGFRGLATGIDYASGDSGSPSSCDLVTVRRGEFSYIEMNRGSVAVVRKGVGVQVRRTTGRSPLRIELVGQ